MTRQQEGFTTYDGRQLGGEPGTSEDLVDLVRELTFQGSHLAEQQIALIKAEVRESTDEVKAAVGSMAGAAVVGIAGLGVTLMVLAYLVGDAIGSIGAGALIVGAVTLLVGYLLYSAGSRKLRTSHLAPDRTRRTLERTPDVARGELHTEHRP